MVTGPDPGSNENTLIGYDKELKDITDAIARFGSGAPSHVAIIAQPMGGGTKVVNELRHQLGDRVYYLALDAVITQDTMPDFSKLPQDIILVDNCQFLATRRIGGFDVTEDFLRYQITAKKLFITTWNLYAWQYLNAVMNIDAYFPTIVVLPKLDMPVIKKIILSHYKPGEIRFVDEGTTDRSMFYSVIHRTIKIPFVTPSLTIPWLKPNFTVMVSKLPRKKRVQVSVEDVIFEKINRLADGNPGVAILLWENSLEDKSITLSAIQETVCPLSLDINESFILSVILSMKSLHYHDLSTIAGSEMHIDQVLYRLLQQGFIQEKDGYYRISPLHLKCVADFLRKTKRVW